MIMKRLIFTEKGVHKEVKAVFFCAFQFQDRFYLETVEKPPNEEFPIRTIFRPDNGYFSVIREAFHE